MQKKWPKLLGEVIGHELLGEGVLETLNNARDKKEDAPKDLIDEFLLDSPAAPLLLYAHQLCWRDLVHEQHNNDFGHLVRVYDSQNPQWSPPEKSVRLCSYGPLNRTLQFHPSSYRWSTDPSQVGFVTIQRSRETYYKGVPASLNHHHRVSVGGSDSMELTSWNFSGVPLACAEAAFFVKTASTGRVVLEPFCHSRLKQMPQGVPLVDEYLIFDVNLLRFVQMVPFSKTPNPFDVRADVLSMAFTRYSGELVWIALSGDVACPSFYDPLEIEWGQWLERNL